MNSLVYFAGGGFVFHANVLECLGLGAYAREEF
jgi:hypothetical protein